MPDPYAHIASADVDLQARLAAVLELRAADPQQRAMLNAYLSEVRLPDSAIGLDVGCGTGAVTRALAEMPRVREAIGIDPSPVFVDKAREIGKANPRLRSVPATLAPFRFQMHPSTSSCSTPFCVTYRSRNERSGRRIVCFIQADGWPSSTVTTRRHPWQSTLSIRSSRPSMRWSQASSMIHG